jgi:hypothetical protein
MTKGTTSALVSGGQQYGAGSPMQVFISPDDDRGAGCVCALDARAGEEAGSRANRFR